MRRHLLSSAFLLALLPLLALGQESPQPDPPAVPPKVVRVRLALKHQVEGVADADNLLQYSIWQRLNQFGLRVDSGEPTGKYQQYIDRATERWAARDATPGGPPVGLTITGTASCVYRPSIFMGEPVAHVFQGELRVEVTPAGGTPQALGFAHEWGRNVNPRFTKSRVLGEYIQLTHQAILCAILSHPAVREGVAEERRGELDELVTTTLASLRRTLQEKNLADCELARFLDGVCPPDGGPQRR